MSQNEKKWEKTFEIAVDVERVWEAMTNREELQVVFGPPPGRGVGEGGVPKMEVLEVVPYKKLRWSQERDGKPFKAEFTVTFESREIGSAVTVTRYGFGDGEDFEIFSNSFGLGIEHGWRDFILYLETGQLVKRHYDGCTLSALGMSYGETPGGIRVLRVGDKGLAAEAGLERGDRVVRIGGAAVYTRSDVWVLNSVHPEGTELEVEFIRGRERRVGRGRTCGLESRMPGE